MKENFTIRDEIKAYWSRRAETFDLQPGHEIFSAQEKEAWHQLIEVHLGPGQGRRVLDLACGTGVVTHLLSDCGYNVIGMDWSEDMLERVRRKSKIRHSNIEFRIGDAENTMEPSGTYDVIVTRHLVWTLIDPPRAFAHWFALLKPGGRVLIIDGDFVRPTLFDRLFTFMTTRPRSQSRSPYRSDRSMEHLHQKILKQVYFKDGARSSDVTRLLAKAGFQHATVQSNLSTILRAQGKHLPFMRSIARRVQHRYAISAIKPDI